MVARGNGSCCECQSWSDLFRQTSTTFCGRCMTRPEGDDLIDEIRKTDLLLEYAVQHGEVEEAERLRAKLRHLAAMGDRDEGMSKECT